MEFMRQHSIYLDSLGHGSAPIPLACRVGPILMTSGVMGRNRETGAMSDQVSEQAVECFKNLQAILAEAGLDMGDVVRVSVLVKEDSYRDAVNGPWLAHYPDPAHRPARHVAVGALRGAALIQIEAMAVARDAA